MKNACAVSRRAWQVRYADAITTAEAITLEGVRVPFLSLEMLIKSKTTYREQDRADLVRLRDLLEIKRQRGDAALRRMISPSLVSFWNPKRTLPFPVPPLRSAP